MSSHEQGGSAAAAAAVSGPVSTASSSSSPGSSTMPDRRPNHDIEPDEAARGRYDSESSGSFDSSDDEDEEEDEGRGQAGRAEGVAVARDDDSSSSSSSSSGSGGGALAATTSTGTVPAPSNGCGWRTARFFDQECERFFDCPSHVVARRLSIDADSYNAAGRVGQEDFGEGPSRPNIPAVVVQPVGPASAAGPSGRSDDEEAAAAAAASSTTGQGTAAAAQTPRGGADETLSLREALALGSSSSRDATGVSAPAPAPIASGVSTGQPSGSGPRTMTAAEAAPGSSTVRRPSRTSLSANPLAVSSNSLPPTPGSGSAAAAAAASAPLPPLPRTDRREPPEIVLPRWQPDAEVTYCPICHSQFSIFLRKHHCRKCGRVVCASCSPHRITIPYQYIVQPPGAPNRYSAFLAAAPSSPAAAVGGEAWDQGAAAAAGDFNGGERVRLCNPCVPDPNTTPPSHHHGLPGAQQPRGSASSSALAGSQPSTPAYNPRTHYRSVSTAGGGGNGGGVGSSGGAGGPADAQSNRLTVGPGSGSSDAYARSRSVTVVSGGPSLSSPSSASSLLPALVRLALCGGAASDYHDQPSVAAAAGTATPNANRPGNTQHSPGSTSSRQNNPNQLTSSRILAGTPPPGYYFYGSSSGAGSSSSAAAGPQYGVQGQRQAARYYHGRTPSGASSSSSGGIGAALGAAGSAGAGPSSMPLASSSPSHRHPHLYQHLTPQQQQQQQQRQQQQQQQQYLIPEEDECPVCHRELPRRTLPGWETLREQHVAGCIASHSAYSGAAPESVSSSGSSPEPGTSTSGRRGLPLPPPPSRATGMFPYLATEKDCVDSAECTICLEEFEAGVPMARLECLCRFHRACISAWFVGHPGRCPVHQHDSFGY